MLCINQEKICKLKHKYQKCVTEIYKTSIDFIEFKILLSYIILLVLSS